MRDTVQYIDKVFAVQWFLFTQLQYKYRERLSITAGVSTNQQSYRYRRLTDIRSQYARKQIGTVFTPRVAFSYALQPQVHLYAILAKGFSAPTLAEFRPSDGNFYGALDAESGWNMEMGIKGTVMKDRVFFDLSYYHFRLNNAIVRRNSNSGAEYFINAGGTRQQGAEVMIKTYPVKNLTRRIRELAVWVSYSYQPYRFTNYTQGSIDYSNNRLTVCH